MITRGKIIRRRWFLRGLILVAILPALIWGFVPKEPVDAAQTFDPADLGEDSVAAFLQRDAEVEGLTPGAERAIVWAEEEGTATDLVLVYVHGFSATAEEIRPVPERLGEDLGANVVFTRLTGHGLDGAALAEATVENWFYDVDEALAVARTIGDRVVLIGTSTGGTLATMALATGRDANGAILISPNFRIADPLAFALTIPGARHWLPPILGRERYWRPRNEAQARHWTFRYPTEAVFPMAALVEATSLIDHGTITTPVLFYFSDADTVVDHRKTREIAEAWGGPASVMAVDVGPDDDPEHHVIAGEIMSPGRTDATVADLAAWIAELD